MTLKHCHTYKKVSQSSNQFRCLHPDCSHLIHVDLLEGKRAICNGCARDFILTKQSLKRIYPKCSECINSGKTTNVQIDSKLSEELLKDFGVS